MTLAVLFDLDGTLVDHVGASRTAVVRWARTLVSASELDDEALCAEWLRLEEEHFARYLAGEVTFEQQRRARLAGYMSYLGQPAPSVADSDALFSDYLTHYEHAWKAYPGAARRSIASRPRAYSSVCSPTANRHNSKRSCGLLD